MAVPLLTKKIVKKRVKKFKRPQSDWKVSVKVILFNFFIGSGCDVFLAFFFLVHSDDLGSYLISLFQLPCLMF